MCEKKQKIIELESEENIDAKVKFLREIIDTNSEANDKITKLEAEIRKLKEELENLSYKNILLIGNAGSGKSTLANVLIDKSGIFKESDGSVSKTHEIKIEEFENGEVKYRVIDTPGFGDAKLSDEEILGKVFGALNAAKGGFNQIFFCYSKRFEK